MWTEQRQPNAKCASSRPTQNTLTSPDYVTACPTKDQHELSAVLSNVKGGMFLEIFAGVADLTACVRESGADGMAQDARAKDYTVTNEFNLLVNSDYKEVKKLLQSGRVRWVHFAPPCSSCSRGREGDGVAPIRSVDQPEGFGERGQRPQFAEEANTLAIRTALLAKMAVKAGST